MSLLNPSINFSFYRRIYLFTKTNSLKYGSYDFDKAYNTIIILDLCF